MMRNSAEQSGAAVAGPGAGWGEWWGGRLGRSLLALERDRLDEQLRDIFGTHLLQVGCELEETLLAASPIQHRVVLARECRPVRHGSPLCAAPAALPLAAESVDLVGLLHVLEFEPQPDEVLREVHRVLTGEGHLVVTGFNPWSLWGLRQLLRRSNDAPPWSGQFLSAGRVRDWLAMLDFELLRSETMFFRPPMAHQAALRRLQFMERWGQTCCPGLGGVFLLIARKRLVPLTPIKPRWQPRHNLIAAGLAEPSARGMGRRG